MTTTIHTRRALLLLSVATPLVALSSGLLGPAVRAQVNNLNDAINKAGRQRMLSQRIAKAYFQFGQGFDVERSQRVLDASVALFDRQLVELKNYAVTPEIKETYLSLEKSWIEYKDFVIGAKPEQERAKKVLSLSDRVLAVADQGTKLLEAQMMRTAGGDLGILINVAGRQRMLSQRMAKLYQAGAWGLGGAELQAELDKARSEFIAAMKTLGSSPRATQPIKDELAVAQSQWVFFENALNNPISNGKNVPNRVQFGTNIATTSERILEVMDRITGMYEKQAA